MSRLVSSEQSILKPMALSQTIPTSSGLSDLSLCFLTYNVFGIVILFFRFALAFVICDFVFRIVIRFALLGHRMSLK